MLDHIYAQIGHKIAIFVQENFIHHVKTFLYTKLVFALISGDFMEMFADFQCSTPGVSSNSIFQYRFRNFILFYFIFKRGGGGSYWRVVLLL